MKQVLLVILLVFLSLSLFTSCAELIDTKYENVEVVIVDEYYKAAYTNLMWTGKSFAPIYHSATYEITVKYKDIEYTMYDKDTYEKYKDKVGVTVTGVLQICSYDDGTVKYDITELLEVKTDVETS